MFPNFITRQLERRGWIHKSKLPGLSMRNFGFPAAGSSRLLEDWPTSNVSIDSILRRDLIKLRPRARHLALKDPYFTKYLSLLKTNIIGACGMTLKNKASDPPRVVNGKPIVQMDKFANKVIEDAWFDWGKADNCCLNKEFTWSYIQGLIVETCGTDGEVLIRKVKGKTAKNKFNFALQLFEGDSLDIEKNADLQGGNKIRMGVERNPAGQRVAYWLFKSNPSDTYYPASIDNRYERIPASEIIHPILARRIGQSRGYPWAAASMLRMQMLDGYDEGEMIAARAGANKHGFFKRVGDATYQGPTDGSGMKLMDSEPGTWEELPQGLEPVSIDWNHPAGNYDPFVKACLRGIAAGLLVSYPTLANDYASVNFSSGRMAQMEEREVWKCLQMWFADQVCSPIFTDWLDESLMAQAIPLPWSRLEKFNQPNWHGRRWVWVNPVQEVGAKISELNSGLTSLTRALAEQGVDRDELLDEIADDQQALEDRGIELSEVYPLVPEAAPAMAGGSD